MSPQIIGTIEETSEQRPLFTAILLKAIPGDENEPWRFAGIASDESEDLVGDSILRKAIDLSYAQQRGYVNWDHLRGPGDQLGFLTKAEIIPESRVGELKKTFPGIKNTASIYVEGELYKNVPRAQEVYQIMKSLPEDGGGALGLSVDGSIARDVRSGGIIKAFVRGVAITTQPTHPNTLLRLSKSLEAYNQLSGTEDLSADLPGEIAREVVEQLETMRKSVEGSGQLNHDQAVLFVLRQRPTWTYELADKVVKYVTTEVNRR